MRKIWTLILSLTVVALVAVSVFLFGQNQGLKNSAVKTQNTKTENNTYLAPSAAPSLIITAYVSPTSSSLLPNIIIDQELNLPPQDAMEIKSRNINPFLDWEKDQGNEVALVKVAVNNGDKSYPYKLEYVMKNGANGGYLTQRNPDNHIAWYMPECLNGCEFSSSFKAKYPEIVSKY